MLEEAEDRAARAAVEGNTNKVSLIDGELCLNGVAITRYTDGGVVSGRGVPAIITIESTVPRERYEEIQRRMTGFLATLSPAQQEAAKAYRGEDWEGYQPKVGERCVNNGEDCVWDGEDFAPIAAKPLVILESPYGGDVERNTAYARACLLDSLRRGEAPIASHLLHTQVLDDRNKFERKWGIEAGLAWYRVAEKCVVYEDFGMSPGMAEGTARARSHDVPVEYRRLEAWRDAA